MSSQRGRHDHARHPLATHWSEFAIDPGLDRPGCRTVLPPDALHRLTGLAEETNRVDRDDVATDDGVGDHRPVEGQHDHDHASTTGLFDHPIDGVPEITIGRGLGPHDEASALGAHIAEGFGNRAPVDWAPGAGDHETFFPQSPVDRLIGHCESVTDHQLDVDLPGVTRETGPPPDQKSDRHDCDDSDPTSGSTRERGELAASQSSGHHLGDGTKRPGVPTLEAAESRIVRRRPAA